MVILKKETAFILWYIFHLYIKKIAEIIHYKEIFNNFALINIAIMLAH